MDFPSSFSFAVHAFTCDGLIADSGIFPGDQDTFNGDFCRVQALANG